MPIKVPFTVDGIKTSSISFPNMTFDGSFNQLVDKPNSATLSNGDAQLILDEHGCIVMPDTYSVTNPRISMYDGKVVIGEGQEFVPTTKYNIDAVYGTPARMVKYANATATPIVGLTLNGAGFVNATITNVFSGYTYFIADIEPTTPSQIDDIMTITGDITFGGESEAIYYDEADSYAVYFYDTPGISVGVGALINGGGYTDEPIISIENQGYWIARTANPPSAGDPTGQMLTFSGSSTIEITATYALDDASSYLVPYTYSGPNYPIPNLLLTGSGYNTNSFPLFYDTTLRAGVVSVDTITDVTPTIGSPLNFSGVVVQAGENSIIIGYNAGDQTQGDKAIAIGNRAGKMQGYGSVVIGDEAGGAGNGTNAESVAIGTYAGKIAQSSSSVAIGTSAGRENQGSTSVAVGMAAGAINQSNSSVAVGPGAGSNNQANSSVAIGSYAGAYDQKQYGIAIGATAGLQAQSIGAIAIGHDAARQLQQTNAIAIGKSAASYNQGANSIAIGANATTSSQPANSIILNATGAAVSGQNISNACYINPIRSATAAQALFYNPSTKEVSYAPAPTGSASWQEIANGAYTVPSVTVTLPNGLTWTTLRNQYKEIMLSVSASKASDNRATFIGSVILPAALGPTGSGGFTMKVYQPGSAIEAATLSVTSLTSTTATLLSLADTTTYQVITTVYLR